MTCRPVSRFMPFELWHLLTALLCRIWTSGMETASTRRVHRAWHISSRMIRFLVRLSLHPVPELQKEASVYMDFDRMTVQLIVLTKFYQRSQIHNTDPVWNMTHNRQVMSDKQVSQSHFCLHILQHVYNLWLDRNVQCGNRLITYDKFRFNGKCTGNADTSRCPPENSWG